MPSRHPVADLAEISGGRQLSPSKRLGLRARPYLRAANIAPGKVSTGDILEMDFTASEEETYLLRESDIVLVEGGNDKSVGAPALITDDLADKYCFQNTVIRVRVKPEAPVSPGCLFWALRAGFQAGDFASLATGSTIKHLGVRRVVAYQVTVPDAADQPALVALLDALQAVVTAARAEQQHAAALRRHLVTDWVASYSGPFAALGDLAPVKQGLALRKVWQGLHQGDIPWFKIADMTLRSNLYGYTEAATQVTQEMAGKPPTPAGSVVFPRVGAAVLTEKKRLLHVPGYCDENHLIVLPSAELDPAFTLAYLEHQKLSDLVQAGAVPSLNQGIVRNMQVPKVTIEEQRALSTLTEACRRVEQAADEAGQAGVNLLTATLAASFGQAVESSASEVA